MKIYISLPITGLDIEEGEAQGKGKMEVNDIETTFRTPSDRDKCIEEIKSVIGKYQ